MKKAVKKAKPYKFKPSPYKAEPIRDKRRVFKNSAPKKKKPKPRPPPPAPIPQPEPKPVEQPERKEPMAEHPKLEKVKEIASRIAGKIRNLENKINAARSTPPDPELAAEFDGIQREVEALKDPESAPAEENDDNGKKAAKKK